MHRIAALLTFFVATSNVSLASAQSLNAKGLRQQFKDKQQILRNFSSDVNLHFAWDGSSLNSDVPHVRQFAIMDISDVEESGNTLTLKGLRSSVALNTKIRGLMRTSAVAPVVITIKLPSKTTDLSGLMNALFYPSYQEAVDAVPEALTKDVPAPYDPDKKAYVSCPECSPPKMKRGQASAPSVPSANDPGITPPKLLKSAQPDFSGLPSMARIDGSVLLRCVVSESGKAEDIWVVHPIGYGLDEPAADALSKYVFEPASKDGKPLPVQLNVAVHVSVF